MWKIAVVSAILAGAGWAQATQRVNLSSNGEQANDHTYGGRVSADGRYVTFWSRASNLVPGDTNGWQDTFLRDRLTGTTERVSVGPGGVEGDSASGFATMSADGRYVAFSSVAGNFVPGDTNQTYDVFVRDRVTGSIECVSVDPSGAPGNTYSTAGEITPDGRYVAFYSEATNLVPGDTNHHADVFVRDRQMGTTERVSVSSGGVQGNSSSVYPSISDSGRYVTFWSDASNLVAGDTNSLADVFVRDRVSGTTERVSVSSTGGEGNGQSSYPSISGDGRLIAFQSDAMSLVAGDGNGVTDIFVRDWVAGTTQRVSVATSGIEANDFSLDARISSNGRYVVFQGAATNLVPGDGNASFDIFVRDLQLGTTERVSLTSWGTESYGASETPWISADGRFVSFDTYSSGLVPGDTNGMIDVLVRDRLDGSGFTSACEPGVGGVVGCPCANPPAGPGRGCNNSSSTGGATLSASGGSFLSCDSLMFNTNGEKPTATSVLLQGTSPIPAGTVYGQGVRCVGGNLKRLFTRTAAGGSITVPNFGAGDPSISARSAAKGDPITAGQSRYYLVFYRDPIVLGGCPASSTFNATQMGQVPWSP